MDRLDHPPQVKGEEKQQREEVGELHASWSQYREFEEFTLSEKSELTLMGFLAEWEARLNRAVAAGCHYSDRVLAFKLLEKALYNRVEVENMLTKVIELKQENSEATLLGQVMDILRLDILNNTVKVEQDVSILLEVDNKHPEEEEEEEGEEVYSEGADGREELGRDGEVEEGEEAYLDVLDRSEEQDYDDEGEGDDDTAWAQGSSPFKDEIKSEDAEAVDPNQLIFHSEEFLQSPIKKKRKKRLRKLDVVGRPVKKLKSERAELKPRICSYCNREFRRHQDLVVHERTHTGERPFVCQVCHKSFTQLANLSIHERTHSGEKRFRCEQCGAAFHFSFLLKRHERTHTGIKPFACPDCGKGFSRPEYLEDHKRLHTGERPFQCQECGKDFTIFKRLKCHMTVHTGEKAHMCPVCGKRFSDSSNLRRHVSNHNKSADAATEGAPRPPKRPPSTVKPFECEVCAAKFTRAGGLAAHRKLHSGERPHACETCGKRFSTTSTLRKHAVTHTGVRLFSCEVCEKSFSASSSLKRHKEKTHTKESEPFNY